MCYKVIDLYFTHYLKPLKELDASETELHFLRLLGFFTPIAGLSENGRKTVMSAKKYYLNALQKTIQLQNPSMSHDEVSDRLGALLYLQPCLEVSNC